MKRKLLSILLCLTMLAGSFRVPEPAKAVQKETEEIPEDAEYVEGEVLAVLSEDVLAPGEIATSTQFAALSESSALSETSASEETAASGISGILSDDMTMEKSWDNIVQIRSKKYSTEELIAILKNKKEIAYVEPNYIYHPASLSEDMMGNQYADYLWHLNNTGQNGGEAGEDVNIEAGWAEFENMKNPKEVVVAVVDTGIDYNHEDLKDIMWENKHQKVLLGEHGYDFGDFDADPMDTYGHGTHCAGIIAANIRNTAGVAGVAPNVKLMALKMFDSDMNGTSVSMFEAYQYMMKAKKLGVNVVAANCSITGNISGRIEKAVMNKLSNAGIIVVTAAGNDGKDLNKKYASPSNLKAPLQINVAASNERGELAGFSNYGDKVVDIAAPGTNIVSTVPTSQGQMELTLMTEECKNKYITYDENEIMKNVKVEKFSDKEKENGIDITASAYERNFNGLFLGKKGGSSQFFHMEDLKAGDCVKIEMPISLEGSAVDQLFLYHTNWMGYNGGNYNKGTGTMSLSVECGPDACEELLKDWRIERNDFWRSIGDYVYEPTQPDKLVTIVCRINVEEDGDYAILFDNSYISMNFVEAYYNDEMTHYQYMSGTSMAAPIVTGAVALLSQFYDNPEKVRMEVLGCVNKKESMEGKVASGGILDLSKLGKKHVVISNASFDKKKNQITFYGENFGKKGSVMIREVSKDKEKAVPANGIVSWKDDKIVIDAKGYLDKKLSFTVKNSAVADADSNSFTVSYLFCSEKIYPSVTRELSYSDKSGVTTVYGDMFTDGDDIYYSVESRGVIYRYDRTSQKLKLKETADIKTAKTVWKKNGLDPIQIQRLSDLYMVHLGGRANQQYFLVSATATYRVVYCLVKFDTKKSEFYFISNMPEKYRDGSLVGTCGKVLFQDKLYFIGGYDENGKYKKDVISYSLKKHTWNKEASLPYSLAYPTVTEYNGRLILLAGTKDVDKEEAESFHSNILIFKNGKWKETKANLGEDIQSVQFSADDKHPVYMCTAAVNKKDKKLYIASNYVSGLGQIYTFDPVSETLKTTKYALTPDAGYMDVYTSVYLDGCWYVPYFDAADGDNKPYRSDAWLSAYIAHVTFGGK